MATGSPLLCAAGVSLLCSTICRLLPFSGITRLRWYYETIRLPATDLRSSLWAVVGHTLGLSLLTALSCSSESSGRGLPGCRAGLDVTHAMVFDPEEADTPSPLRLCRC